MGEFDLVSGVGQNSLMVHEVTQAELSLQDADDHF